MTVIRPIWRRVSVITLCGIAAPCLIFASVDLEHAVQDSVGALSISFVLAASAFASLGLARRLHRATRSKAAATGRIVLFEWPMLGPTSTLLQHTRGPTIVIAT